MHPLWSGVIGFGLVNIPVNLYSPASETTIDLDFLHKKDHSPVRYARICKAEEKEIPYDDIIRGFQYQHGSYVELNDKDFEHANVKKSSMIDIKLFTDKEDVDFIYAEKPYYLEPALKSEKSYALFREALQQSGKIGIATFVMRTREHLAAILPYKDVLVLDQLRFAHEIKPYTSLNIPKEPTISKKELAIALELIKKMGGTFKPKQYHDTYAEEIAELIEKKIKGARPSHKGEKVKASNVKDLMALLKASLEAQKPAARV